MGSTVPNQIQTHPNGVSHIPWLSRAQLHPNIQSVPHLVFSPSDSEPQRRQNQPHTRKKPVKEEQTSNEQNPTDSSSAEEKGGQVR